MVACLSWVALTTAKRATVLVKLFILKCRIKIGKIFILYIFRMKQEFIGSIQPLKLQFQTNFAVEIIGSLTRLIIIQKVEYLFIAFII